LHADQRNPDIGYNRLAALLQLLSLSFGSLSISARLAKRGLWMAAKNVSVSYHSEMSPDMLSSVLRSGVCPPEYASNIGCFLDETPLELVVMVVEEAAAHAEERQQIWSHVARLALQYGSARNEFWAMTPGVELGSEGQQDDGRCPVRQKGQNGRRISGSDAKFD
tara:strand:+ start:5228 stop:5722 length:495 start_codon:yes stop_codon:yes gene_type:complete